MRTIKINNGNNVKYRQYKINICNLVFPMQSKFLLYTNVPYLNITAWSYKELIDFVRAKFPKDVL